MADDWFAQFAPAAQKPAQPAAPGGDFFAQFEPLTPPPTSATRRAAALPSIAINGVPIPESIYAPVSEAVIGAGKELLRQGVRGGEFLREHIPGLDALSNALPNLNNRVPVSAMTPEGAAEKTGAVAFQVAEAVAPSRAVTALGARAAGRMAPTLAPMVGQTAARLLPQAAIEAGAGGGIAAVQGNDPITGAALSGAAPLIGAAASAAAGKISPALREAAEQQVQQALGATKERFKAMAKKITPEILKRGIRGSREAIKAQADYMLSVIGPQVDDALKQYGDRVIGTAPVLEALETAKDAYRTTKQVTAAEIAADPELARRVRGFVREGVYEADVLLDPRPIEQLSKLQKVIGELGEDARVDQVVAIRRAWDKVVAGAGGYAQRASGAIGQPLADQSEAWAKKQATTAIRQLLDDTVPEIGKVNKEFAFWKSLDDVLGQTLGRTAPQKPGLARAAAESAGAVVGGLAGSSAGPTGTIGGAVVTAKLATMLNQAFASPRWKLASAQLKDALAEAIAAGNVSRAATILGRIGANRTSALTPPREGAVTIYSNRPSASGVPE